MEIKKKSSGKIENIFVGKILHKDNNIKVAYKNTGDVYFVPEHKGVLKNFLGLRKQEFFLDQRFVFPGKTIDFSGIMKNVPVWGIFQIKVRFVDGMGVVSESNKYACGYLFPWLALAFCAGGIFLVIVILRKRNQMKIWLLMKK